MSTAYEKIMKQNGFAAFKRLVKKWERLSENIGEMNGDLPVILPDIFLVSRSGTGRTNFLRLLSEYLAEKENLMHFYGDVPYFEFMLGYCAPENHFSEIQRLMDEITNAAGFRNEFRGIVYIDINEWRGHTGEKNFLDFMEYLSDNSDEWLVVLSLSDDDPEQIKEIESLVSFFLRIEKLVIENPTLAELVSHAKTRLAAYGFTLDDSAASLLSDSLKLLRKNKYFDGYKTVNLMCLDIIYSIYTLGKRSCDVITLEDLALFSPESEYISRTAEKIKNARKIGFC